MTMFAPVSSATSADVPTSPKSSTFTVPSAARIRLAGFTSRWMSPAAWAWASPRAASRTARHASATGSGPRRTTSSSTSPFTYSMTRKWTPPASSAS